jgi:hypothetical protein
MTLLNKLTASRSAVTSAFDVLDQLREATASAKAEVSSVQSAPPPVDEIMTGLDIWLDRIATDGFDALRPGRLLAQGGATQGLDLPIFLERHDGFAVRDTSRAVEVLLGLVVALNRETFRTIIRGQIEDLVAGRETLSAASRSKRLAQAMQRVLEAELLEEAAIRQLENASLDVARRPDADPRALLAADNCLPS